MMGGEFGDLASGELVRAAGRQGRGGRATRRAKSEFGFFRRQAIDFLQNRQGKSLEILGKSLEKAWKSLEKFGNAWKSLEKFGRRASARRSFPFRRSGAEPSRRRSEAVRVG
jgi:hypothetical protein